MSRLIDADELPVHKAYCVDEAGWGANFYVVDKSDIDKAPTIDAVPVVRCEDCKHSITDGWICGGPDAVTMPSHPTYPANFCSYGERRSE